MIEENCTVPFRTLVLVGTHLSNQHIAYLKNCWTSMSKICLLKKADIIFYVSNGKLVDPKLFDFAPNVKIFSAENHGYQRSALMPMHIGFKKGWFRTYDWIIRMNPDVIIADEKWLLDRMLDTNVHGIFGDCNNSNCRSKCKVGTTCPCVNCTTPRISNCGDTPQDKFLLNSDFYAVRYADIYTNKSMKYLKAGQVSGWAEAETSYLFGHLVNDGRVEWITSKDQHKGCRIKGDVVYHDHSGKCMKDYLPNSHRQDSHRSLSDNFRDNVDTTFKKYSLSFEFLVFLTFMTFFLVVILVLRK